MSVKEEMDSVQKLDLKSYKYESESFTNNFHKDKMFEVLQSSRNKNDRFCDIKLQTDDGTVIYGHKNILASATPYFNAMFSNFGESNKDLVNIKKLDSTILKLLIDYIYTGKIMITRENAQVVLAAANLLQLEYVKQACVEFIQKQLDPSNCLSIKVFADLNNCIELLSKCEEFIKKQFLEMVKYDEFLSLSSEEVIKLISCNDIAVPFEEKVYECVLKWVKHELNLRKHLLPNLMEHVRLSLISKAYLLENVVNEHLLNNDPKCKNYVFEALHFNLIKSVNPSAIPETIRNKPRRLPKIVLVFSWCSSKNKCIISWYDPATNQVQIASENTDFRQSSNVCVVKDQFVFVVNCEQQSVVMLDTYLQSHCFVRKPDLLVSRLSLRIGVLNDCIYAIGCDDEIYSYSYDYRIVNTVEVFSLDTQKWQMVTSMPSKKSDFGVGVLNNLLYAVGGYSGGYLKSVDCYDPIKDSWAPIAEMSISRNNVGVGVLDGIMYAIGGSNESEIHKSVEAYNPSDGVWTSIADMHMCRDNPGVVALYGLLYVIGGNKYNSVEIYNPKTNSWSMKTVSISDPIYGAVVVNRPPYL
ncbi:ring canal kelch homolog [Aphis gossypii]|uniref:ring canal kelch homolog n=1 Tax=Aphis gossypii TaxID=80765 RepID=UPI002158DE55|nr:ring canal kelch homolog [Aphis gossypii]XP_050060155.1 ring canal kelch homolog [Aphis gossypii]